MIIRTQQKQIKRLLVQLLEAKHAYWSMKRKFLDAETAIDILIRDGVKAEDPPESTSDDDDLLMAHPNPYSEQAQRAVGNAP
eukprot:8191118-Prorocentrum_lima.AAC.1